MSIEFTPEQEKIVQERLQEKERQLREQWIGRVEMERVKVLRILKAHYGEEVYHVLVAAKGNEIISAMSQKREDNSLEAFIDAMWTLPDSFENTITKTESGYQMNVTKCPMYDLAKRLGITEEDFYLICENDQFVPEGFNPNIGYKRTKTLMQGHECCDHFYFYKNEK